jgi:tetratricopeptide (TPR) repeat protein
VKVNDVQERKYLDLIEFCNHNKELANKVSNHLSRAIAYINNRWFKRVLREYEEITKIVPTNTIAYNAQVDILIMLGENDKAIEICKQIIDTVQKNNKH